MATISINGSVLYADMQSAVPDAQVRIMDVGRIPARELWRGSTDSSGKFRDSFGWNNPYILPLMGFIVDADGHSWNGPWVKVGDSSIPIIVPWLPQAPPQIEITGEVWSPHPQRRPLSGVHLDFYGLDVLGRLQLHLPPTGSGVTDDDGRFNIPINVPSGPTGTLPFVTLAFIAELGSEFPWPGVFFPFSPTPRIIWVPWGINALKWRISDHGPDMRGGRTIPSNSRYSATIFNFATVKGETGRHHRYADSGHRFEFKLIDGCLNYRDSRPGESPPSAEWREYFTDSSAISYHRCRRGENFEVPKLDLLAAGGNRLFAKEEGTDRLFFALIDDLFLHQRQGDNVIIDTPSQAVPGTFFKLDPEAGNAGADVLDLLRPVQENPPGIYNKHPATLRFPLYRWMMRISDIAPHLPLIRPLMPVRKQTGQWHQLDARPPMGNTDRLPPGVPTYQHIVYQNTLLSSWTQEGRSLDLEAILDIGVGSVHLHESYSEIYGGEMQPLLTEVGQSYKVWLHFYQLFNGQVRDGDGFVDGTCNFYMLGRLRSETGKRGRYALLYLDEQSGPSERWELVGIREPKPPTFSLAAALADPTQSEHLYGFERNAFWDPFVSGCINDYSRLAVAQQMIAVNGVDSGKHEIYTINFSWATCDRTWRTRALPPQTVPEVVDLSGLSGTAGKDPDALGHAPRHRLMERDEILVNDGRCRVFPQSVRLREDSTLVIKGEARASRDGAAVYLSGRYVQKLLPSDLAMSQPRAERKPDHYTHQWRFIPEWVFQRMDLHSHLGVYEPVDSRSQYYVLKVDRDNAQKLRSEDQDAAIWEDIDHRLSVSCWRIPYELLDESTLGGRFREFCKEVGQLVDVITTANSPVAFLQWLVDSYTQDRREFSPPSQFNQRTLFRLRPLGDREVIATFWDKRDDDLIPLKAEHTSVRLRNVRSGTVVTVLFEREPVQVSTPPMVRLASLRKVSRGGPGRIPPPRRHLYELTYALPATVHAREPATASTRGRQIRRIVVAYIDPDTGSFKRLLDLTREAHFEVQPDGLTYMYRFTPAPEVAHVLSHRFSSEGALRAGATIYFEDVVGQKNTAEEVNFEC